MNYFQPYSLPADQTILAAWDSQLVELSDFPEFVIALAKRRELFPRFAESYARLRALPRGTRKALQRKLAHARELISIEPEWQRKLAGSLAGAALLLALAQSASAAMITVTTNVPDINDGDGKCSLIEAIVNANDDAATHPDCAAGDGADAIVLPKGSTHTLTSAYANYHGDTGLPLISSSIIIEGNGGKIGRPNDATGFRIIALDALSDLTLHDVTLTGGLEKTGGGILNYGHLNIIASSITGNRAYYGGGIFNGSTASLTVQSSTISVNQAARNQSGLAARSSRGGGILNYGSTTIIETTISGNIAGGPKSNTAFGGGIASYQAYLKITNSTISRNSAIGEYLISFGTDNAIRHVTQIPPWSGGGGIRTISGTLIIQNSTVSNNTAGSTTNGRAYYGRAGGLWNGGSDLTIINSTFSGNWAEASGGGIFGGAGNGHSVVLRNNLISGNYAFHHPEIYHFGIVDVDDFNLFGYAGNAGVYGFTPGPTDIVPNVAVKNILGPLQDNGGPTLTHALVKNSPALDAAPVDANCPATDQRGVGRPQGAACDIGAVEGIGFDEPPPPPQPQPTAHNFVVTSVKAPKSIKHGGGTASVTVTIRNAGNQSETLSDISVLGDGAATGLVRLAIDIIDTDGEQCEPAAVSLNGSKNAKLFSNGVKVLKAGASLTVNFLVTYRCDAPQRVNKRNPEAGDFSNSASVFPDELDGISASNATSTLAGAATKVTF